MRNATVKTVSELSGIHGNTIRRWADRGIIESKRDFRGWRFFPDPSATAERIRKLLNGEIRLEQLHSAESK